MRCRSRIDDPLGCAMLSVQVVSGERVNVCLVQRHLGALSSRARVAASNMRHANVLS